MEARILPSKVLEAVKKRKEEIDRLRFAAYCHQLELQTYLSQAMGVDLSSDGWELDLDEGTISRAEPPALPPEPAAPLLAVLPPAPDADESPA